MYGVGMDTLVSSKVTFKGWQLWTYYSPFENRTHSTWALSLRCTYRFSGVADVDTSSPFLSRLSTYI